MDEEIEPARQLVVGLCASDIVELQAEPIRPPPIQIDTGRDFVTDRQEKERDTLIKWARGVGKRLKFGIIVRRSDKGEKPFFVLTCERSGKYMPSKKKLKYDVTGTRKCECPFRLRDYYSNKTKLWRLSVVNGLHNHELDKEVEGHLVVGRLNPKEKVFLEEMTRNLFAPRNILSTLKERDQENKTTTKQLYNLKHRCKAKMRALRTEMQHLFKLLADNKYFFKYRSVVQDGAEYLQDIFFSHPNSVSLFKSFPTVLMMDSTYKTNKYDMRLFEVVGFTSTEKTFNVGFAWLTKEREDNFTWALQQLRLLVRSEESLSKVILTDKDTTLMKFVAQVFPTSAALVCRFHVEKNVNSKLKEWVQVKQGDSRKASDVWNDVSFAFKNLLASATLEEYTENVLGFRKMCEKWPRFLRHVEQTVLDTDKEKVVNAWVDKYMHMENHTTNRVESAHGVLKKYLTDGGGDLVKGWEAIHKMLGNQFTRVKELFGQSMSVEENRYRDVPLCSLLIFKVSRAALDYIHKEAKRVKHCGTDSMKCGCLMRKNYGLPCACLIAKKLRRNLPIRPDEVYSHWKRLCIDSEKGGCDVQDDYACSAEWQAIQERLRTSDVSTKNEIRNQLCLIAYPESTSLKPPLEDAKSKRGKKKKKVVRGTRSTSRDKSRWEHVDEYVADTQASQSKPPQSKPSSSKLSSSNPSSSNLSSSQATVSKAPIIGNFTLTLSQITDIHHMPKCMHPYIEDMIDVEGDEYCGYRSVALYDTGNESDFELIRLRMIREMKLHRTLYVDLLGGEDRWKYINDALYPPPRHRKSSRKYVASKDNWFMFPYMGHIVATVLDRVVVQLSRHGFRPCETFFPLRGIPPADPHSKVVCLGALPDHYVLVKLKEGCPIPKTNKAWKSHCRVESKDWETCFSDRQKIFEELMSIERGDVTTVGFGSKDNPMTID